MKTVKIVLVFVAIIAVGVVAYFMWGDKAFFKASVLNMPSIALVNNASNSIIVDEVERSFVLHVPSTPAVNPALVVVLHGGGVIDKVLGVNTDPAALIVNMTNFSKLADQEGFIVVYPEALQYGETINGVNVQARTWNAGFCCGTAATNNVDDVGFVNAVIGTLNTGTLGGQTLGIDMNKIYVTGISNGAFLAYKVGAEMADVVAAIAPVAGSIGGYTSADIQGNPVGELMITQSPLSAVSVIAFNGTADNRVPYDGGVGPQSNTKVYHVPVSQSINFWTNADDCKVSTSVDNFEGKTGVTKQSFFPCKNGVDVNLFKIAGGGHVWPDITPLNKDDIPWSTTAIWGFFKAHPKIAVAQ